MLLLLVAASVSCIGLQNVKGLALFLPVRVQFLNFNCV